MSVGGGVVLWGRRSRGRYGRWVIMGVGALGIVGEENRLASGMANTWGRERGGRQDEGAAQPERSGSGARAVSSGMTGSRSWVQAGGWMGGGQQRLLAGRREGDGLAAHAQAGIRAVRRGGRRGDRRE